MVDTTIDGLLEGVPTDNAQFVFNEGGVDSKVLKSDLLPSTEIINYNFASPILKIPTATKTYQPSNEDASVSCFVLSADKTKGYMIGNVSKTIYQYDLTVTGDVNTAVYSSKSLDVSARISRAGRIAFSPDGTKLFLPTGSTGQVEAHTLSTPWDITTATYTASLGASVAGGAYMVVLSDDGTKLYSGWSSLVMYTLSTPWDITTATYTDISSEISISYISYPLVFADGGRIMKIYAQGSPRVYTLSTPWDITTAIGYYVQPSLSNSIVLEYVDSGGHYMITIDEEEVVSEYSISVVVPSF